MPAQRLLFVFTTKKAPMYKVTKLMKAAVFILVPTRLPSGKLP